MTLSLHHHVAVLDARAHLLEVVTTVRSLAALPSPLTLFMPVWTPGSYLVREYARHVEAMTMVTNGAQKPATKIRKNAWRIDAAGAKAVTVRYRLYCNELTVRTNHLDETHAFLNGAATFLAVEGSEGARATIEIALPAGWELATSLPAATGMERGPSDARLTTVEAADLDTLADCPIEIGVHREERFLVLGKPHAFVVWPKDRIDAKDLARLTADTQTLLETEARLFGGALPYESYLALLYLSAKGRGGLEHKSGAALLASPAAFSTREGYVDLLSLIAHEAFHAWNVKRIRPEGLTPYRYQEENYTRLLWWFEGATSYYDWRVLRLSKLCTVDEYLDHLATEIGHLDQTHGRLVHALEEASFDAWIKLYRPDENTPNSTVSYYRKGEIVCAMLDLEIRGRTAGRVGLDAILLHLWERYGAKGVAVPEGGMQEIFERVAEVPLGDLFDLWVRAPGDVDYGPTLARVGLAVERPAAPAGQDAKDDARDASPRVSLGLRVRSEAGRVLVAQVVRGAAAQRAGIDPGDELVAIAGRRVEGSALDPLLVGLRAKEDVEVTLARDGRLVTRTVTLDEARPEKVKLIARPDATPSERALFLAWLGDAHPAGAAK